VSARNQLAVFKWRGANYRNFLMSLRTKIAYRRDLDIDFLCKLYEDQKGLCAISGRELTFICGNGVISTNISIDRIKPLEDYTEENVRLVCRQANTMKQRFSDEELADWCRDIVETYDKRKKK
jgi:hypothetical protein